MMDFSESTWRLAAFLGVFAVMALIEIALPKRTLSENKGRRWFTNIAIGGIDSLVVRLMATLAVPVAAVAAAAWAGSTGWGILNWTDWPLWLELLIGLAVLDFTIYLQHIVTHKIPILWRLHRVHHSDLDFDVTTAIRFHPIEIALSMLWKITVVILMGPSAFTVFLFEVILNGCAMFNHANVALPLWLDRVLRMLIVTPDMHRVHHSVIRGEHDSNYGFNLSIWDRVFRTYRPQPDNGHDGMTIGLRAYRDDAATKLGWSLALPFAETDKDDDETTDSEAK